MLLNWLISCFIITCSWANLIDAVKSSNNDPSSSQKTVSLNDTVVCDCGFEDENHRVWTDIWYADYSVYKTNLQYDPHYLVMDYTVGPKQEGSLQRVFSRSNVKIDNNGGVTLSVNRDTNGKYTSAAIGTKRNDFLYGTYRARLKTTNISGTVAAFFFYRNDTSEIDIESLSRFSNPYKSYFAIQPQIYMNGMASPLTSEKHDLDFNPTEDYHEYRFDWLPGSVKFYIDDIFVREMITNVPNAPGRIILNHWTDGNPNFSGGPPMENADLKVSYLNLFFNSSETKSPLACQRSKTPCLVTDIMNQHLLPGTDVGSDGTSVMPVNSLIMTLLLSLLLLHYFY